MCQSKTMRDACDECIEASYQDWKTKGESMPNEIQRVQAEIEGQHRYTPAEVQAMAQFFAKSGFYAMTMDQAISLMFIAQSKGLHPATAMERYHIIKGRPSMKAEAMLAEFQRDGGRVEWVTSTEEKAEAIFWHDRHCPKGFAVSFTREDAKRANLLKNDVWQAHPRNMLRSRVITNGVRMIAPGVVLGIYTPDEIDEFDPPKPIETTARASMPERHAPRRERPHVVAEVVKELKAHEPKADPEPTTEWGKWIVGELDAFNREHHAEVHRNQVINAVLTAAIEDGRTMESEILSNRGKRHGALMTKEMARLWETDEMWVMATVGAYFESKLPEAVAVGADDVLDTVDDGFPKAG